MSVRNAEGQTAFINARLLDPASGLDILGGVVIDGELIASVGAHVTANQIPQDIPVVDCQGLCLAPGLVDIRVQLREPGDEHKETLRSAAESAVAGGVTSMVCLPNTNPVIDDVPTVEFVARRARLNGLTKVYPYAAATKNMEGQELSEMGMLAEAGALGFTDGTKAIRNALALRRALSYAATFGALIIQHPEDPSLSEGGCMNEGELATRMGLAGIPAIAEAIILERDMRLVELTGGRYHAAHVSTAEGLDVIRKAKAKGLNVTCDTAPPYFALNEYAVSDYRTFAKLSPPLRSDENRLAVVAALVDGTIDVVVSDHAPQDQESKRLPFALAEPGGVGLETLLAVTLDLYHSGHMSLLDTLALITHKPADLLGLQAGRLKPGNAADLVIFDPIRGWKVDPTKFRSKSKNSPFDGRLLQGTVEYTVVDGRTVFTRNA